MPKGIYTIAKVRDIVLFKEVKNDINLRWRIDIPCAKDFKTNWQPCMQYLPRFVDANLAEHGETDMEKSTKKCGNFRPENAK